MFRNSRRNTHSAVYVVLIEPTVVVCNKYDLGADAVARNALDLVFPDALFVSAKTGKGLHGLRNALSGLVEKRYHFVEFTIPQDRYEEIRHHRFFEC